MSKWAWVWRVVKEVGPGVAAWAWKRLVRPDVIVVQVPQVEAAPAPKETPDGVA